MLFVSPEYNRGIPGVLKNAIDVGSRPYGQSVFDKKPAAIVTASPGAIGGFGANHQIRQACVFLNMPVMQQPEAYLGHVTDDSFDEGGCLKEGPLKELVTKLAHAFHDWVDMIHRSRQLLAEDSAHAAQQSGNTHDPSGGGWDARLDRSRNIGGEIAMEFPGFHAGSRRCWRCCASSPGCCSSNMRRRSSSHSRRRFPSTRCRRC